MTLTIKVNGVDRSVDVDGDTPLLWVLRDVLGMTGTKFGCGMALCGACTVHLDGVATRSCITPIDSIGLPRSRRSRRSARRRPVPRSRRPGSTTKSCNAATASRARSCPLRLCSRSNPHPTDADIDDAMSGNICRCGTYLRIREAIKQAAQSNGQGGLTMILDHILTTSPTPVSIAISRRPLPAQVPPGRSGGGRRPAAEPQPAARQDASRGGRCRWLRAQRLHPHRAAMGRSC